ncbi:U4/U6 small nuclear ribonucleoprotein Prp31, partial [Frankliniella fusca]
ITSCSYAALAGKCTMNEHEGSTKYFLSKQICQFVDSIISCDSNDIPSDLAIIQTHAHSHTCKKKNGSSGCRFDIPYFPMNKTRILHPQSNDDQSEREQKYYRNVLKQIKIFQEKEESLLLSYDEFLHVEYLTAIRLTLHKSQIFLKRQPKDIYHHNEKQVFDFNTFHLDEEQHNCPNAETELTDQNTTHFKFSIPSKLPESEFQHLFEIPNQVYQLRKIMRQNELHFQKALNNLAKGDLSSDDLRLFQSRTFSTLPKSHTEKKVFASPANM